MIREHLMRAHPERDGAFRWRGDGVSRIEGLSDAVFGFAVTLLVVSLEVPKTFDELARGLLSLPAFAATFTLLVLVWFAQYRFFRRYGLEDGRTILLNVALLFVVLFYIYPLKFLFQTFIAFIFAFVGHAAGVPWLAGLHAGAMSAIRGSQWPWLMCIYALGWCALYTLFALMHRHALARAAELQLDPLETLMTRFSVIESLIMVGVGLFSAATTLVLAYVVGLDPALAAGIGGWSYFLIWPAQHAQGRALDRRRARLGGSVTAEAVASS